MASAKTKLRLQERVPLPRTAWKLADLAVLFLLLALLARRASSLVAAGAWFTVVWLLNMNAKWNPVRFDTHPERLAERTDELPAVDMFVTTADPKLEPPLVTVNTLSCYVSDDGCSAVTCYALREAAEFAKLWVPFCKKHGVKVRAPFVYFSERGGAAADDDDDVVEFLRAWTSMKNEYEELVRRIENAEEYSLVRRADGEFAEFVGADRRNHPTIIKVLWDSSNQDAAGDGIQASLRLQEKSPTQNHHFKAGAMNVLVALHAMCLLLASMTTHSGFVQAPQKFYGASRTTLRPAAGCRLSVRAWNNHRMQRIVSSSAWLCVPTVVLRRSPLGDGVRVTRKEQKSSSDGGADADDADPGRFTFDSSPVFVPPTALTMLSIVAVAVGAWRLVAGAGEGVSGGSGVGELVCCGWLVLCFWPFVRGLVGGRGSYSIPWSVRLKAALLVAAFVHLSTRK
ncbi:hypothetical protein BDA96_06G044100 [Sorghum bicolor]|uniref:Uncharacterized protein n=1 Tax=Sorghum bicolor TaxID=4558 RepID=A0A921QP19_SORBI|nr:hypothetical protein BDA96_06G044100 [Sorghum bicolor]